MATTLKPNLVFVFTDQWRAQATGYAGDPNVRTPHLDRLADEGVHCTHAVSGWPVCSPARASLITGQYPLTHGVFVNDVCLSDRAVSLAQAFGRAGYATAYIGKWHLDGHGRSNFIPRERRQVAPPRARPGLSTRSRPRGVLLGSCGTPMIRSQAA